MRDWICVPVHESGFALQLCNQENMEEALLSLFLGPSLKGPAISTLSHRTNSPRALSCLVRRLISLRLSYWRDCMWVPWATVPTEPGFPQNPAKAQIQEWEHPGPSEQSILKLNEVTSIDAGGSRYITCSIFWSKNPKIKQNGCYFKPLIYRITCYTAIVRQLEQITIIPFIDDLWKEVQNAVVTLITNF